MQAAGPARHVSRARSRLTAKARAMGREFSRAMEDAAKESGLDEALVI
ncbi:MAG: hypothetical protein R3D78_03130 [Paracoccaceae bacterium]